MTTAKKRKSSIGRSLGQFVLALGACSAPAVARHAKSVLKAFVAFRRNGEFQ